MLELRHVPRRFAGIAAVENVSFTARAWEVTGYLGPNGSGKSTTMKMITGLIEMSAGQILFDGAPIHRDLIAYEHAHDTRTIFATRGERLPHGCRRTEQSTV